MNDLSKWGSETYGTESITLDAYERDNLLWLLEVARRVGLDTGDWLGQIRFKLRPEIGPGTPNMGADSVERTVVEIQAVRLTYFERVVLLSCKSDSEDVAKHALIDRLLGGDA